MEKLKTIQKVENLNAVYRAGEPGAGGACHFYVITRADDPEAVVQTISFQHGPRNEDTSVHGALDCDLLEIVMDRLKAFQAGPFACDENSRALIYLEQALIQMNLRVENRVKRGVLGTMQK